MPASAAAEVLPLMRFFDKSFDELSARELYAILRARSAVFVLEQKCLYQDMGGIDSSSRHVWAENEGGELAAYLRHFPKAGEPGVAQIGRVLTLERGTGLGRRILEAGIESVRSRTSMREIHLEAQCQARGFYERLGFAAEGEPFDEDGIPHIAMRLTLS